MKTALNYSKIKKIASYFFIYGLINKTIIPKINKDINAQKEAIRETKLVIDNPAVNIDVQFDDPTKKGFSPFGNCIPTPVVILCHMGIIMPLQNLEAFVVFADKNKKLGFY